MIKKNSITNAHVELQTAVYTSSAEPNFFSDFLAKKKFWFSAKLWALDVQNTNNIENIILILCNLLQLEIFRN